jgi:putative transposase ISC1217
MNKSLLDLYTDYLISSFGQTTATGLSQLLDGEISHDQVTRFLASQPKTSADLWRVVKPLVRQVERDDAVLIIDDSIEVKPHTDENQLICWHWDHSKQRNVKGINFLTALYCASEVALSLADKQRGHYQAISTLDLPEGTTSQVWLEAVEFPLLAVKEVFTNEDGSQAVLYLVTSDLKLDYDHIITLYKRRWSVEVYHKSLKQNGSLEKSPTRTTTTQRNHLYGSLCA